MLIGALAGGCSSDETLAGSEAKTELRDYCAKSLAVETYPEPDFRALESLDAAAQTVVVRGYSTQILPLVEQASAAAPPQLRADGAILVDGVRLAAQSGDPSGIDSAAVTDAENRVHAFDLANCGWASADVTADEYSFSGVPRSVKAGPLSFQLTNEGAEPHDLTLFRINDDVTDSVKDIVALPQDEARRSVTIIGIAVAQPGATDYKVFELTKGRYGVVCMVPLGANGDGAPHATEGMYADFTVT